jgi:flagellar export protein FliJ
VWHRNWILAKHQQVERAQRVLDLREDEARRAAAAALEAQRKRKALERLRTRALLQWTRAEEREEQKVIDELATSKHARHQTEGGP